MVKTLSIDIGFKKPGIVLIEEEEECRIKVYTELSFDSRSNSIDVWNYFFSQNIDKVIIEQQHINSPKNFGFMGFIEGFFLSRNVPVSIVRPFACNIKGKTREERKSYSVNYLNQMLVRDNVNVKFLKVDSDICDAINIGLKHLKRDSIHSLSFHRLQIK